MEGSSVMWMYHSHTDEVGDTYAGLMGPIVVTATARPARTAAQDVDREFVACSGDGREPEPYCTQNIERFAGNPPTWTRGRGLPGVAT